MSEEILPNAIYTTEEASKLLHMSKRSFQRAIADKRIKAAKYGGTWYRIRGEELLKFFKTLENE